MPHDDSFIDDDVPQRRPRPTFDSDYGPYLGAPGDPRNDDDQSEDHDDESQNLE